MVNIEQDFYLYLLCFVCGKQIMLGTKYHEGYKDGDRSKIIYMHDNGICLRILKRMHNV